ncbi:MAG: hypothetical protein BWY76_03397 [bacterium ADurb.Bin429]|nr:MAG: hypothetical protein BWY76_03397 [bacterium ADurb.Bin429]
MATPLGVYLTTGVVGGGVGDLGLVLSGMAMALLFWLAQALLASVIAVTYHFTREPLAKDALNLLKGELYISRDPMMTLWLWVGVTALLFLFFLLLMRVAPLLAGYHAAEHQTVHAMEAGKPLTLEAVARMPRVHPRCGTNLWAIMQLSLVGLGALATWLSTDVGRYTLPLLMPVAVVLAICIAFGWRALGGWLQQYFTTRRPSAREIASGIRAGLEVTRCHLTIPPTERQHPSRRIWNMGLLQVALGIAVTWPLFQWLTGVLDRLLISLLQ